MSALIRKYSLFYLTATGTFFFLCAYSLAADAPNYPFLPALFFPLYLAGAMSMSERESGDNLLNILPVTPSEIMKVKFGLIFVFVVIGWLNMTIFTFLQSLEPELAVQVTKLNTISSINTLLLAALFQVGIHFFGWNIFQKVILLFTVIGGIFGIVFFIGLAESGHNHPDMFPLIPFLESLPFFILLAGVFAALGIFYLVMKRGPWSFNAGMENY